MNMERASAWAALALLALVSRVDSMVLDRGAAVLSPLEVRVLEAPRPVRGADDRIHLAYELALVNSSPLLVTVDRISAIVPNKQRVAIQVLEGDALAAVMQRRGGEGRGRQLRPSHSAFVFMDVSFPGNANVPSRIAHEFVLSLQPRDRDPSDHADIPKRPPGAPPSPSPPPTLTFMTDAVQVNRSQPVIVSPPLSGSRWYVENGCCAHINAHRSAVLPLNGTLHVPERFAIDFVQLRPDFRLFNGDGKRNADYAYFGVPVRAVADGVIVSVVDGIPDNAPGAFPPNPTLETAGGNHVVVDMGNGRFAFYAHLQNGTVTQSKLQPGQRVRTGSVLGLLGNSGNSDAPHLHFHVMDGPDPLHANGLPFEFTHFHGEGLARDDSEEALFAGSPAVVDASALRGPHVNRLPLDFELVGF